MDKITCLVFAAVLFECGNVAGSRVPIGSKSHRFRRQAAGFNEMLPGKGFFRTSQSHPDQHSILKTPQEVFTASQPSSLQHLGARPHLESGLSEANIHYNAMNPVSPSQVPQAGVNSFGNNEVASLLRHFLNMIITDQPYSSQAAGKNTNVHGHTALPHLAPFGYQGNALAVEPVHHPEHNTQHSPVHHPVLDSQLLTSHDTNLNNQLRHNYPAGTNQPIAVESTNPMDGPARPGVQDQAFYLLGDVGYAPAAVAVSSGNQQGIVLNVDPGLTTHGVPLQAFPSDLSLSSMNQNYDPGIRESSGTQQSRLGIFDRGYSEHKGFKARGNILSSQSVFAQPSAVSASKHPSQFPLPVSFSSQGELSHHSLLSPYTTANNFENLNNVFGQHNGLGFSEQSQEFLKLRDLLDMFGHVAHSGQNVGPELRPGKKEGAGHIMEHGMQGTIGSDLFPGQFGFLDTFGNIASDPNSQNSLYEMALPRTKTATKPSTLTNQNNYSEGKVKTATHKTNVSAEQRTVEPSRLDQKTTGLPHSTTIPQLLETKSLPQILSKSKNVNNQNLKPRTSKSAVLKLGTSTTKARSSLEEGQPARKENNKPIYKNMAISPPPKTTSATDKVTRSHDRVPTSSNISINQRSLTAVKTSPHHSSKAPTTIRSFLETALRSTSAQTPLSSQRDVEGVNKQLSLDGVIHHFSSSLLRKLVSLGYNFKDFSRRGSDSTVKTVTSVGRETGDRVTNVALKSTTPFTLTNKRTVKPSGSIQKSIRSRHAASMTRSHPVASISSPTASEDYLTTSNYQSNKFSPGKKSKSQTTTAYINKDSTAKRVIQFPDGRTVSGRHRTFQNTRVTIPKTFAIRRPSTTGLNTKPTSPGAVVRSHQKNQLTHFSPTGRRHMHRISRPSLVTNSRPNLNVSQRTGVVDAVNKTSSTLPRRSLSTSTSRTNVAEPQKPYTVASVSSSPMKRVLINTKDAPSQTSRDSPKSAETNDRYSKYTTNINNSYESLIRNDNRRDRVTHSESKIPKTQRIIHQHGPEQGSRVRHEKIHIPSMPSLLPKGGHKLLSSAPKPEAPRSVFIDRKADLSLLLKYGLGADLGNDKGTTTPVQQASNHSSNQTSIRGHRRVQFIQQMIKFLIKRQPHLSKKITSLQKKLLKQAQGAEMKASNELGVGISGDTTNKKHQAAKTDSTVESRTSSAQGLANPQEITKLQDHAQDLKSSSQISTLRKDFAVLNNSAAPRDRSLLPSKSNVNITGNDKLAQNERVSIRSTYTMSGSSYQNSLQDVHQHREGETTGPPPSVLLARLKHSGINLNPPVFVNERNVQKLVSTSDTSLAVDSRPESKLSFGTNRIERPSYRNKGQSVVPHGDVAESPNLDIQGSTEGQRSRVMSHSRAKGKGVTQRSQAELLSKMASLLTKYKSMFYPEMAGGGSVPLPRQPSAATQALSKDNVEPQIRPGLQTTLTSLSGIQTPQSEVHSNSQNTEQGHKNAQSKGVGKVSSTIGNEQFGFVLAGSANSDTFSQLGRRIPSGENPGSVAGENINPDVFTQLGRNIPSGEKPGSVSGGSTNLDIFSHLGRNIASGQQSSSVSGGSTNPHMFSQLKRIIASGEQTSSVSGGSTNSDIFSQLGRNIPSGEQPSTISGGNINHDVFAQLGRNIPSVEQPSSLSGGNPSHDIFSQSVKADPSMEQPSFASIGSTNQDIFSQLARINALLEQSAVSGGSANLDVFPQMIKSGQGPTGSVAGPNGGKPNPAILSQMKNTNSLTYTEQTAGISNSDIRARLEYLLSKQGISAGMAETGSGGLSQNGGDALSLASLAGRRGTLQWTLPMSSIVQNLNQGLSASELGRTKTNILSIPPQLLTAGSAKNGISGPAQGQGFFPTGGSTLSIPVAPSEAEARNLNTESIIKSAEAKKNPATPVFRALKVGQRLPPARFLPSGGVVTVVDGGDIVVKTPKGEIAFDLADLMKEPTEGIVNPSQT